MKAELERIWNEEPIAWPLNIAGWCDKHPTISLNRCYFTRKLSWSNVKIIGKLFTFKGKRNRVKSTSGKSKKATR